VPGGWTTTPVGDVGCDGTSEYDPEAIVTGAVDERLTLEPACGADVEVG
jgi:hypothetical protein